VEGDEYATFSRFPVTVTHLPVTRCQICDRAIVYRPGNIGEVLTQHYRRRPSRGSGYLRQVTGATLSAGRDSIADVRPLGVYLLSALSCGRADDHRS
jgi:hypothetical protein